MTICVELTPDEVRALEVVGFFRVALPSPVWLPDGNLATSILVGRTFGGVHAYANLCRHRPVPLDTSDAFSVLAPDGQLLVCRWHGALYRSEDGSCVAGPCIGQALFRAKVILEAAQGISVEL